jgi:hypothetical protein
VREFNTIEEFQQYRKVCPVCRKPLYFKGCGLAGNSFLMKVSYKSEDFIFNISTKTTRIGFTTNVPVPPFSNRVIVSSVNPLKITCICAKKAKEDAFRLANEYTAEIAVVHSGKSQGYIQKIQLLSESFVFFHNKRFFSLNLTHNAETCSVEEFDNLFKVKKIHNLKYDIINQDKISNKDYIINKIQTISMLQ